MPDQLPSASADLAQTPQPLPSARLQLPAVAWLAWLVASGLELRLAMLLHGHHFRDQVMSAWGVTIGQPHWRVYQNRLGGPMLARAIADLTELNPALAFAIALFTLIAARNLWVLWSGAQLGGTTAAGLRAMGLTAVATLALSDPDWLYLWDYTDLLVFSGLGWLVLGRKEPRLWLIWLAFAAICKESALFIAAALALTGLLFHDGQRLRLGLRDKHRVLAGIIGALAVAGLVEYLRAMLLVRETMPASALQTGGIDASVIHIPLAANLKQLATNLVAPTVGQNWLVDILIVAIPAGLWHLRRRLDADQAVLAAVLLAMYLSMLMFGVVNETRLYTALVPLAVYLDLSLRQHRSTPGPNR